MFYADTRRRRWSIRRTRSPIIWFADNLKKVPTRHSQDPRESSLVVHSLTQSLVSHTFAFIAKAAATVIRGRLWRISSGRRRRDRGPGSRALLLASRPMDNRRVETEGASNTNSVTSEETKHQVNGKEGHRGRWWINLRSTWSHGEAFYNAHADAMLLGN